MKKFISTILSLTIIWCMVFLLPLLTKKVIAENVNYNIADGLLKFDVASGTITGYTGNPTDVLIPSKIDSVVVTNIGNNAFSGCSSLTSISIPNGVTSIGDLAFCGCSNLSVAYFYGNAPSMSAGVFNNTKAGFTIYYLEGKTGFTNPFNGYSTMTFVNDLPTPTPTPAFTFETIPIQGINIDANNITLNAGQMYKFKISYLPENTTQKLLMYSTSNKNIVLIDWQGKITAINSGIAEIKVISSSNNNIFASCNVTVIDPTPTPLSSSANANNFDEETLFLVDDRGTIKHYNGNASNVNIPNEINGIKITSIGDSVFRNCKCLTSISIPNGVTSIGNYTFDGCNALTNMSIPNSVTSIGDYAFNGCSALTSISIPNNVASIGNRAFGECSSLTSVAIPRKLKNIGEGAFYYCSGLTRIEVSKDNSYYKSADGVLFDKSMKRLLSFPAKKNITKYDIPSTVIDIAGKAFGGCIRLTNINIPNSVERIGDAAFLGCSRLVSIRIPDKVTSIADWSFYKCINLTSISFPSGVIKIGNYAFFSCHELKSISIPSNVKSIGVNPFSECYKLTIYGETSSVAECYTKKNNIKFVASEILKLISPTGMSATVNGTNVNLTWNVVTSATSYKVYYKTQNGSYKVLTTKSTKLKILRLGKSTKYYFKVAAVNSAGEGKASVEISKTTGK